MTLLQIRNIVDYILTLQEAPVKLTKERFTDMVTVASLEYFEEQLRQKNWDNLRPFIKIRGDHQSPSLPVANGVATLPGDFFQPVSAVYRRSTKDAVGNIKITDRIIEKTDSEMFDDRHANPVTTPTIRYPVINYRETHARVSPKEIRGIILTYITLPIPPVYAQKMQNGVNVYDPASSTELQWTDDCIIDIIRKLLQQMGIKVGRGDIVQVTEAQAQKDKEITV